MKQIKLSHGNGGQENNELITKVFYKAFKNGILEQYLYADVDNYDKAIKILIQENSNE